MPVGFERFCSLFRTEFELGPEVALSRATHFELNLSFDSLEFLRLAIFLEMLAPIDLPGDVGLHDLRLGDAYDFYVQSVPSPEM